jgi:hypothetical protein
VRGATEDGQATRHAGFGLAAQGAGVAALGRAAHAAVRGAQAALLGAAAGPHGRLEPPRQATACHLLAQGADATTQPRRVTVPPIALYDHVLPRTA